MLSGYNDLKQHTFNAASCTFGFLFPIRRFSERMASLGGTVLERMTSDISRFSGMSSLLRVSNGHQSRQEAGSSYKKATYKLEEVARSIWSSRAVLPDPNQPAMVLGV